MDVFGKALWDYHNGQQDAEITITRDDGHVDAHGVAMYFAPDPFPFEARALADVKGPVLDVGCGAGRHLLWLAGQGIKATGIDLSQAAVELCKARGCPSVIQGDVTRITLDDLPTPVQTITMFGNNAGIGGTFAGTVAMFRALRGLVGMDGQLIMTGIDLVRTTNPQHQQYHANNVVRGRRRGEIEMQFTYQGETSHWMQWYHPEPDEVREIAAGSGWQVSHLETLESGFFWAGLQVDHEKDIA